jgi:hypothetical protein
MSVANRGGSPGHGPARELDDSVRWGGDDAANFSAPAGVAKIVYTSRALSQVRTARPTTWSILMQFAPDYGAFAGEGPTVWTAIFQLLTGVGQTNIKMFQSVTFTPGAVVTVALPIQVTWPAVPASHITSQIILVRGGLAPVLAGGPFTGVASSLCAPYVFTEEGSHRQPPPHVPYGFRREHTYGERLNGDDET